MRRVSQCDVWYEYVKYVHVYGRWLSVCVCAKRKWDGEKSMPQWHFLLCAFVVRSTACLIRIYSEEG